MEVYVGRFQNLAFQAYDYVDKMENELSRYNYKEAPLTSGQGKRMAQQSEKASEVVGLTFISSFRVFSIGTH